MEEEKDSQVVDNEKQYRSISINKLTSDLPICRNKLFCMLSKFLSIKETMMVMFRSFGNIASQSRPDSCWYPLSNHGSAASKISSRKPISHRCEERKITCVVLPKSCDDILSTI